jgi:phosphohistidine phosphatase
MASQTSAAKRLFLLRHTKSNWGTPGEDDFDRPLAKRGRKAAQMMAEYFRTSGIRPETVLCSPAKRTRETFELIAKSLGKPTITYDLCLYEASAYTLMVRLAELSDDTATVLLIGHNPGLERLALDLAEVSPANSALAKMHTKFPTGALAELTVLVGSWGELGTGTCRLDNFVRPIDLEKPV